MQTVPTSLLQAFKSWRSENASTLAEAERQLLSIQLNLDPNDPNDKPKARLMDVALPKGQGSIHTLQIGIQNPGREAIPHAIVLIHGFGAGLGLFCKNFESLAKHATADTAVFAIDLLGMGRSTRVRAVVDAKTEQGRADQAESFFVDSIEAWRTAMGIEKLTLIAHSLGGYFSSCYAVKHQERVERLVLLAPAGMIKPKVIQRNNKDKGVIYDILHGLWRCHLTPLDVIRPLGPLVALATAIYVGDHLYSGKDEAFRYSLYSYCYGLSFGCEAGSENALFYLLGAGAVPKFPLADRFRTLSTLPFPVRFIYGSDDWIGRVIEDSFDHLHMDVKVAEVPKAGHLVFWDAPEALNVALDLALQS